MSDKHFAENEAFSKCFSNASLLIFVYHTLRSFRQEATCKKMGIVQVEILQCLEVNQLIAHSKKPEDHTKQSEMLRNTKLDSVVSYFMVSCDSLKNQQVCELKDLYMNLGQVTNNRFESKFNKLKTIYKPNAVLLRDFNIYISNKKRYKSSSFNDTKLQKDAANKNKIE